MTLSIELVPLKLFSARIADGWTMVPGYPLKPGDWAVTMLNERNADLAETEGAILRLEDKKRRLLLSIEGWKAQLDALERPEREAIDRAADELDRELALPDLSAAIADAPAEVLEAAE